MVLLWASSVSAAIVGNIPPVATMSPIVEQRVSDASSRSVRRARDRRDLTVPTGTAQISAHAPIDSSCRLEPDQNLAFPYR
jgi:hypothetical protein